MSENTHLDRRLLRALGAGDVPPHFITLLALRHVSELCPHCRKEILHVQNEALAKAKGASFATVHVLKTSMAQMKRQHGRAERDLKELLTLPPDERLGKIRRARTRFQGSHLVHLLLAEAERHYTPDPEGAIRLVTLAQAVIRHSNTSMAVVDLEALVYAHLGNAHRVANKISEADKYFKDSRTYIRHSNVTDPAILARIDEFEASLRKDQRRFARAEELFTRALILFAMSGGAQEDIARVLINFSDLRFVEGRPAEAAVLTRFSLELLTPIEHPQLHLFAQYNLALQLAEAGSFQEAAGVLETHAALFDQIQEPWLQLRLHCARAKIADSRGDREAALRLFEEAREGFIGQGSSFDVAIVSMELALLHVRTGDTAAVKALADEMVPLFEAQDVHREAVAALILFQQAVQQESTTIELVEDLATYLKRARQDPALRFTYRRGK